MPEYRRIYPAGNNQLPVQKKVAPGGKCEQGVGIIFHTYLY